MKEKLSRKFEESKIFPECNYNGGGTKHIGKCWDPKPRICYHCREPGHFIKDCPLRRGMEQTQATGHSSMGDNMPKATFGQGRGRGN